MRLCLLLSKFTKLSVCLWVLLSTATCLEETCTLKPEVVVPDAEVKFGLLLSLRSQSSSSTGQAIVCGSLLQHTLEQFLTAEWLVNRINNINNGSGYLPGIKIGFETLDDCGSPLYASRNTLTLLDHWYPQTEQCDASTLQTNPTATTVEPLLTGIVGTSNGDIAQEVASMLAPIPLPIISMAATNPGLNLHHSNFFRTIPSDSLQMEAILDLMVQLKWTYVAVIHTDDTFSQEASVSLNNQSVERGICIHETLMLTSEAITGNAFSKDLYGLLQNSKDHSLAVIFIGSTVDAEYFLWNIDHLVYTDDMKFGFRVLLTAPLTGSIDTKIFENINIGEGTLSMAGATVDMAGDLEADMQALIKAVKDKTVQHALIEEFLAEHPEKELFQATAWNSFVPLTVHAVLMLVESLKSIHTSACQGLPGLCSNMVNSIGSGNLLSTTKAMELNYASMQPGIAPAVFGQQGLIVRFDDQGNVVYPEDIPIYTVHQCRKEYDVASYFKVGEFMGNSTHLNVAEMMFKSSTGQMSNEIPSSVCASRCDDICPERHGKSKVPLAFMAGTQGYIIGVFPLHDTQPDDPFKCGDFRYAANDVILVEGFLYAVEHLRDITGLDFGALAIDSCYSPVHPLTSLYEWFSSLPSTDPEAYSELEDFSPDQVLGVIACRSSGCTIPVAAFFMQLQIPVVSYASSSPDLDDPADFPYFLRTVPSDEYQAQVLLDIVRLMGWEYVGLLYVKNNYGIKAMQAFKKLAQESRLNPVTTEGTDEEEETFWPGVCVAKEVFIEERASVIDERHFLEVRTELTAQNVKVVIFIGIDSRFRAFLNYLERADTPVDFIFLASEDWGVNPDILQTSRRTARGSITLKVEEVDLEDVSDFRTHLKEKKPSLTDRNVWFLEFWQNIFQCNWPGGFINTFDRDCDPDWTLSESELTWRTSEQRFKHTMNAVYALGKGMVAAKELCEDEFPCNFLRLRASEVTEHIRQQSRTVGTSDFPVFDKEGNGALGFDAYSVQKLDNGEYDYIKVGEFNPRSTPRFEKEKLKFYTVTGGEQETIDATCTTALCGRCPIPADKILQSVEAVHTPSKFQDPDIVIISLLCVLILAILVAAAVLCLCRRNTVLKQQLSSPQKERIYDEPGSQLYQQYMDTHGFSFANAQGQPLLHELRPGMPGYDQLLTAVTEGYHNEAFISDNVDSVSQVIPYNINNASRHQSPSRQTLQEAGGGFRPDASLCQTARPLSPSLQGLAETASSIVHDNRLYHNSGSDFPRRRVRSNSTTPTHGPVSPGQSTTTSSNNANMKNMHSSGTTVSSNSINSGSSGATMNTSQVALASPFYPSQQLESGVMQHVQNANGQPVAYLNPISVPAEPGRGEANLQPPKGLVLVPYMSSTADQPGPRYYSNAGASRKIMYQQQHMEHAPLQQHHGTPQHQQVQNPTQQPLQESFIVQRRSQSCPLDEQQLHPGLVHLEKQQQEGSVHHSSSCSQASPLHYYPQPQYQNQPLGPLMLHSLVQSPQMMSVSPGDAIELQNLPKQVILVPQQQLQMQQHNVVPAISSRDPGSSDCQPFHAENESVEEGCDQPHCSAESRGCEQGGLTSQEEFLATSNATSSHDNVMVSPVSEPGAGPANIQSSMSIATTTSVTPTSPTTASGSDGHQLSMPLQSQYMGEQVDIHFDPSLSHDPRPPNHLYLESIDLSSTDPTPEVTVVGFGRPNNANSNNNNNNSTTNNNGTSNDGVILSALGCNVSKV